MRKKRSCVYDANIYMIEKFGKLDKSKLSLEDVREDEIKSDQNITPLNLS